MFAPDGPLSAMGSNLRERALGAWGQPEERLRGADWVMGPDARSSSWDKQFQKTASLGESTGGKFAYPFEKRGTRENVEALRRAESHLDTF